MTDRFHPQRIGRTGRFRSKPRGLCGAPFRDLPSGRDFQGVPRVPGMAPRSRPAGSRKEWEWKRQTAKQQADAVNVQGRHRPGHRAGKALRAMRANPVQAPVLQVVMADSTAGCRRHWAMNTPSPSRCRFGTLWKPRSKLTLRSSGQCRCADSTIGTAWSTSVPCHIAS